MPSLLAKQSVTMTVKTSAAVAQGGGSLLRPEIINIKHMLHQHQIYFNLDLLLTSQIANHTSKALVNMINSLNSFKGSFMSFGISMDTNLRCELSTRWVKLSS